MVMAMDGDDWLDAACLSVLERAAEKSNATGSEGKRVTLVFGTSDFADLLVNWALSAVRAHVHWFVLVAMDRKALSLLCGDKSKDGISSAVANTCDHVVLLPRVAQSLVTITKLNVIGERQRFGVAVLNAGFSVLHADADAIFLKDPSHLLSEGDVVASRIWGKPQSVVKQWGAGLCTGFYYLRSIAAVRTAAAIVRDAIQAKARRHATSWQTSDQLYLNTVLSAQRLTWEGARMAPLEDYDARMHSFARGLATVVNASWSLRLVVLPHVLVPRACPVIGDGKPSSGKLALWRHLLKTSYALHCFPPNSDPPANERMIHMGHPRHTSAEVRFLQRHGLWRLPDDWRSRPRLPSFTRFLASIDTPRNDLAVPSMLTLVNNAVPPNEKSESISSSTRGNTRASSHKSAQGSTHGSSKKTHGRHKRDRRATER